MINLLCLLLLCSSGSYEIYDCSISNCEEVYLQYIDSSYYCAFYDLRLEEIMNSLDENKVLVDEDYFKGYGRKISMAGLMHNKFCSNGYTTITGSFNPTFNGLKNQNRVVVIHNEKIAQNYLDEWREINEEKKYGKTKHNKVYFDSFVIENYFCPEDNCEEKVKKTLQNAEESIYFEQFSFTSKELAETLVIQHIKGIKVIGILDKRSAASKYSVKNYLERFGINVSIYNGSGKLHTKMFIVDETTYILGSYNPTKNGNERNDENLVIIRNS